MSFDPQSPSDRADMEPDPLEAPCASCGEMTSANEPHLAEWFEGTGELLCFSCWEEAMSDEASYAAEDHDDGE